MKKSRLQKNLILFTCFNVFLIGFMLLKPLFKENDEHRESIQAMLTESSEIEGKIFELEVIMVDIENQLEKCNEKKTDLKDCMYDKLEELGSRKVGKEEINKIFESCFKE